MPRTTPGWCTATSSPRTCWSTPGPAGQSTCTCRTSGWPGASMSSSGLTRAGQFLGTPDYAAPEQISGRDVDGRADQYALACVAYTLLSGTVLFRREVPMAVLYAHLSVPPPRLTAAAAGAAGCREPGAGPGPGEGAGRPVRQLRDLRRRAAGGARPGALRSLPARRGARHAALADRGDGAADHPAGPAPDQAVPGPSPCPPSPMAACRRPPRWQGRLAVPAGRGGNLDRGGGRGPRLLRQRAGGQRPPTPRRSRSPPSSPNGGSGSPGPRSASGGAACPATSSRRST